MKTQLVIDLESIRKLASQHDELLKAYGEPFGWGLIASEHALEALERLQSTITNLTAKLAIAEGIIENWNNVSDTIKRSAISKP